MNTPKVIRNLTASDVFVADTGTNILAGADYTIPDREYLLWSESESAPALVDGGSLAVLYGATVLSSADGKAFLRFGLASAIRFNNTSNGFTATDVQAAIEEAAASGGSGSNIDGGRADSVYAPDQLISCGGA